MSRIGLLFASGDSRDAEILTLRHQILVLQRRVHQPQFTNMAPLKRFHVLFMIEHATRRIHLLGITAEIAAGERVRRAMGTNTPP